MRRKNACGYNELGLLEKNHSSAIVLSHHLNRSDKQIRIEDSMKQKIIILGFLAAIFTGIIASAQDFSGPPPGEMPKGPGPAMKGMSEQEKVVLDTMMSHPELQADFRKIIDEAGGPQRMKDPEVQNKIKALIDSSKKSSQPQSNQRESCKANCALDMKALFNDLKSTKSVDSKVVKLSGLIPKECKDKIEIQYSCNEKSNIVEYIFTEQTHDAFSCLEKNKSKCDSSNRNISNNNCVEMSQLNSSKIKTTFEKENSSGHCQKIELNTVKVSYTGKLFNGGAKQNIETEGQAICLKCLSSASILSPQLEKNREQAKSLVEATSRVGDQSLQTPPINGMSGPPPFTGGPTMNNEDKEAMIKHFARVKERMIKKIKSSSCIQSGDGDSEMEDSSAMFGMMGAGGPSPGGQRGKGMPGMSGMEGMPTGKDAQKIAAMDPEFMDDIQDAIDAKQEKCMKESKKQQGSPGNMIGMNSGSMGGMNSMMGGYGSMGGMNSMMGGYGSMGGMNSMTSGYGSSYNPYMMSNYGNYSPLLNGYSNNGYLGNYNRLNSYNSGYPGSSYNYQPTNYRYTTNTSVR